MTVGKKVIGVTSDLATCLDCSWNSQDDVYNDDVDRACKDHVKFWTGHRVNRETVTATHYKDLK